MESSAEIAHPAPAAQKRKALKAGDKVECKFCFGDGYVTAKHRDEQTAIHSFKHLVCAACNGTGQVTLV